MSKLSAIVEYSGGGVQHLGNQMLDIRLALDNWPVALEAYRLNHRGTQVMNADLSEPAVDILAKADWPSKTVDLLSSSPPCPGFSAAKNQEGADIRREHLFRPLNWMDALMPAFFVLENVRGLVAKDPGKTIYHPLLIKEIKRRGYTVDTWLLCAHRFGAAQTRRRVFVVAKRKGKIPPPPEPTHGGDGQPRLRTLRDAIGDLTEKEAIEDGLLPMSEGRVRRISKVKEGAYMFKGRKRPMMDKEIKALTTSPISGRCSVFVHPLKHRHLGVREFAYIMGVPEYRWLDSINVADRYKILGNGNPPDLLNAVYARLLS